MGYFRKQIREYIINNALFFKILLYPIFYKQFIIIKKRKKIHINSEKLSTSLKTKNKIHEKK